MFYLYYCKSYSALEKKKRHSAIILSSNRVGDLLENFVQLWEAKYFKIFSMRLVECYTGKVAIKILWRRGEEIKGAETSPDKPEMILQINADPWEHRSFGSETPSSMAFCRRPWQLAWVTLPESWVRDALTSTYSKKIIYFIHHSWQVQEERNPNTHGKAISLRSRQQLLALFSSRWQGNFK